MPYLSNDLSSLPDVRVINNHVANFDGIINRSLGYFVYTNWVQEFKPSYYKK